MNDCCDEKISFESLFKVPEETPEYLKTMALRVNVFRDFNDLASAARAYNRANGFKAMLFQTATSLGFTCVQDGTIFQISVINAYKSIEAITNPTSQKLFSLILFSEVHRAALTQAING